MYRESSGLITLHRSPQLLCFRLRSSGEMTFQKSIELSGNVLDMVQLAEDPNIIVVSVDCLHQTGSTQTLRKDAADALPKILQGLAVEWENDTLVCNLVNVPLADGLNTQGSDRISEFTDEKHGMRVQKEISEALYTTNIYRKNSREQRII